MHSVTSDSVETSRLLPRLAFADLRHELILTLCITSALMAIVAPLMLLLGLKHGTIEYHLKNLIEDPVYREIIPERANEFTPEWIETLGARDDVAFVVPNILRGASTVVLSVEESGSSKRIDVVPTAPGDLLLIENGASIPDDDEIVVSSKAREELNLEVGAEAIIQISRGGKEEVQVSVRVVGILDPRADSLPRIYAPFDFVEEIETYRAGRAVPKRGWQGSAPVPFVSFEGVIVATKAPLEARDLVRLTTRTGFARRSTITAEEASTVFGLGITTDLHLYQLTPVEATVQAANINALRNPLRGKEAIVLPYNTLPNVKIGEAPGMALAAVGLTLPEKNLAELSLPSPPWTAKEKGTPFADIAEILIPASLGLEAKSMTTLHLDLGGYSIDFPARVVGEWDGEQAIMPSELAGMLYTGTSRRIAFDENEGQLLQVKDGYRGFRLYARSIDDVAMLSRYFTSQEISVIDQAGDIQRVKRIDRALTRLFQFIAVVGILGGVAAMVASLYAAVERKRRDIGLMRLIGFSRKSIFGFPVTQAIFIGISASLFAFLLFGIFSSIINTYFAQDLPLGERLCYLPPQYFAYIFLITVATSVASSIFAAWRATNIEPAEAIRLE